VVQVNLWAGLRRFTDGKDTVEIKARNVGEILNALENKYPELREIIEAGVSVSVDGRIIASGLTEPVYENSEVFLLQQLKGG
jgi:molybdopterin converting factor small subunit|tara:strand:+ start:893 stop:1138 length:246 start_codon:yes stop_codon:yes gene_type:complete